MRANARAYTLVSDQRCKAVTHEEAKIDLAKRERKAPLGNVPRFVITTREKEINRA